MTKPRATDAVDAHVARWVTQIPDLDPSVEGATTRMQAVVRQLRKSKAEFHAGKEMTLEDSDTLHELMVQPYPVEATRRSSPTPAMSLGRP